MAYIRDWYDVEVRTDSMYALETLRDYAPHWRINADRYGCWYNSKGKMIQH